MEPVPYDSATAPSCSRASLQTLQQASVFAAEHSGANTGHSAQRRHAPSPGLVLGEVLPAIVRDTTAFASLVSTVTFCSGGALASAAGLVTFVVEEAAFFSSVVSSMGGSKPYETDTHPHHPPPPDRPSSLIPSPR